MYLCTLSPLSSVSFYFLSFLIRAHEITTYIPSFVGIIAIIGMSLVYTGLFLCIANDHSRDVITTSSNHVGKKKDSDSEKVRSTNNSNNGNRGKEKDTQDTTDLQAVTTTTCPYWNILFLQLFVLFVYFYAGMAKTELDWLYGNTMRQLLRAWIGPNAPLGLIQQMLDKQWPVLLLAHGGLILDLTCGVALMQNRYMSIKWLYFIATTGFHFTNHMIFTIESFPWVMIASNIIFFDISSVNIFIQYLRYLLTPLLYCSMIYQTIRNIIKKYIFPIIALLFISIHILIPLPCAVHAPFSDDQVWGSQCQYFSWRMMTRSVKMSTVNLKFENTIARRADVIDLKQMGFTSENINTMGSMEDFIYHTAAQGKLSATPPHDSKDVFVPPVVYGDIWLQINGPPVQRYVSSNTDLTSVPPRSFNFSTFFAKPIPLFPWVMPRLKQYRTYEWLQRYIAIEYNENKRVPGNEVMFLAESHLTDTVVILLFEYSLLRVLDGTLHIVRIGRIDVNECLYVKGPLRIRVLGGTPSLWMITSIPGATKISSIGSVPGIEQIDPRIQQRFACLEDHVVLPSSSLYSSDTADTASSKFKSSGSSVFSFDDDL